MPQVMRQAPARSDRPMLDMLCPVIMELGTENFPAALLAAVGKLLPIDHCAGFLLGQVGDPVRRIFSTSRQDVEFAERASRRYADEYWAHDPCLKNRPAMRATIVHQNWNAISHKPFQDECYVTPHVIDRLSILSAAPEGGRILVSVFRHRRTGFFSDWEAETLAAMAPAVATCVAKHGSLLKPKPSRIKEVLSRREQAVAEQLAAGRTVGAMAQALGLAASTVETYRKRVYAKLDVGSRVALLARLQE